MLDKIITSAIISICIFTSAQPVYAFCAPQDDILESDSIQMAAFSASEEDLNIYARPEPIYKTPEAQAFQEYGKFSTEGATGSVDISIPIHTISCRDLQIPIALHYGGRGIKVAEEASWVGLGWDLSVGGCINCVAAGQYDFLTINSMSLCHHKNQITTSLIKIICFTEGITSGKLRSETTEYRGNVVWRNEKVETDYLGNVRAVTNGTTGATEQTVALYIWA